MCEGMCQNGGTCVSPNNCICQQGFTGKRCETGKRTFAFHSCIPLLSSLWETFCSKRWHKVRGCFTSDLSLIYWIHQEKDMRKLHWKSKPSKILVNRTFADTYSLGTTLINIEINEDLSTFFYWWATIKRNVYLEYIFICSLTGNTPPFMLKSNGKGSNHNIDCRRMVKHVWNKFHYLHNGENFHERKEKNQ